MSHLSTDFRYCLRQLARRPGFTAAAVLTLGIGIALTTTMWSVVEALLVRPLPFSRPERLVNLYETRPGQGIARMPVAAPTLLDWRREAGSFVGLGAFSRQGFNLAGGEEAERVEGARIDAELFPTLGVRPLLGRLFTAADDVPGAARVALLSEPLWRRRFAADPDVVGKSLVLDGEPATVVGVMAPRLRFPEWADVWTPLALPADGGSRTRLWLSVVGRLRPGIDLAAAGAELDGLAARLEQRFPEEMAGRGARLVGLREDLVRKAGGSAVVLVFVAALFVLLIACANVAGLQLARAGGRRRELAVRTALGAARARIVRLLLTESLLLGLLGGMVGVGLAAWGIDAVRSLVPGEIPFWLAFGIDRGVLAFALLLSLLTGVAFGLTPALKLSRPGLREALTLGRSQAGAGLGAGRLRAALVVGELAASLVLLVAGALLVRSFVGLQRAEVGFDPSGVLAAEVTLAGGRYATADERAVFLAEAVRRLAALPGVTAAGAVNRLPHSDSLSSSTLVPAGQDFAPGEEPSAMVYAGFPGYAQALRIPLRQGRWPTEAEAVEGASLAVVSQTTADRFWPGQSALGKAVACGGERLTVIGVAGDVVQPFRLPGSDDEPPFQVYLPYRLLASGTVTLVLRAASADPLALVDSLRHEVAALDRGLALDDVATLTELERRAVVLPAVMGKLFGVLAAVALLLAAVGLYGLVAYSVGGRTHEIGVRMALGARTAQVLSLVLRQGLLPGTVGVALGLGGAAASTRALGSFLYGVEPGDPVTFAVVALALLGVVALASWLPARQAARVDPVIALRHE